MEDGQGIPGLRMFVEAGRQEDVGPQVHVGAPEVREEFGPDPDVLHPLRVLGRGDLRNHLVQDDLDPAPRGRIEGDPLGSGVEVPRLAGPLLALTPVGGSFTVWPSDR